MVKGLNLGAAMFMFMAMLITGLNNQIIFCVINGLLGVFNFWVAFSEANE